MARGLMDRAVAEAAGTQLSFGGLTMDEDSFEVWRNDTPVYLSLTEFRLLGYLIRNPDLVLSKARIRDGVWPGRRGSLNLVEAYVSLLRKKIDTIGPPLIQTVRGMGYRLRTPVASS